MKAVDRVMRAYEFKDKVTEEQAKLIRTEVSKFVDELRLRSKWPDRGH